MLILGVILLVIGVGLMVGHFVKGKGAEELRGVERREAGALTALVREIGQELGEGAFSERAEVVGDVECDAPLTSPLGERPCVYYDMSVRREYERTYTERDSQGNTQRKTRRESEIVSEQRESARFRVRDGSGTIEVHPDGARFDGLVKSVDRFDRGETNDLSFGNFVMSLASSLTGGSRTIGYRYLERMLPLDRPLTVIGQVSDEMGEIALRKGEGKLLISTRTRQEILKSRRRAAKLFFVLALIALGGGIALVIAGGI